MDGTQKIRPKQFRPTTEQQRGCPGSKKWYKREHHKQQRKFAKIDPECPPGYRKYYGYGL